MHRFEMRSGGTGPADLSDLSEFCDELFVTLGRSDQRRWAETYVKGLLVVPGRKSIRRISEVVVGRDVDQSLQQFVNQSPWEWAPVRRRLAEWVNRVMRPRAWVVREVVFPKNGASSVGVARQYAPSAGRTLNCQRAVAVFLAGERGATPVNWRLVLPKEWDDDAGRRAKTRLPEGERSRRQWEYLLECFDEMTGSWGLPVLPVVVDLGGDPGVFPLLDGLEERGVRYLARVSTGLPPASANPVGAPNRHRLVPSASRRGRTTLSWRDETTGEVTTSDFVAATLRDSRPGRSPWPRHVLAEWPVGQGRPRAVWATNPGVTAARDLVGLLHAGSRADAELPRLADGFGLRQFEGRSFQGWHHHVTLVSAAHGYALLKRLAHQVRGEEQLLRKYA